MNTVGRTKFTRLIKKNRATRNFDIREEHQFGERIINSMSFLSSTNPKLRIFWRFEKSFAHFLWHAWFDGKICRRKHKKSLKLYVGCDVSGMATSMKQNLLFLYKSLSYPNKVYFPVLLQCRRLRLHQRLRLVLQYSSNCSETFYVWNLCHWIFRRPDTFYREQLQRTWEFRFWINEQNFSK